LFANSASPAGLLPAQGCCLQRAPSEQDRGTAGKKILEGSTLPSMGMHVTIYKTLQSDVVNVAKHYYTHLIQLILCLSHKKLKGVLKLL
jgi:hypothetical protein